MQYLTYPQFLDMLRSDIGLHVEREAGHDFLSAKWLVAGASGGSCWDGMEGYEENPGAQDDEPEDEPTLASMGVGKIVSRVSEKRSRNRIMRALQKKADQKDSSLVRVTEGEEINEYYGNWSRHNTKTLYLHPLYEMFVKLGCIQIPQEKG